MSGQQDSYGSRREAGTPGDAWGRSLRRGAELNMKLYAEQIALCQRAFQGMLSMSYGAPSLNRDLQDLTRRSTAFWSQLAALWMGLVRPAPGADGRRALWPVAERPGNGDSRTAASSGDDSELAAPETRAAALARELQSWRASAASLQTRLEARAAQLATAQAELVAARTELATAKEQIAGLEKELEEAREKLGALAGGAEPAADRLLQKDEQGKVTVTSAHPGGRVGKGEVQVPMQVLAGPDGRVEAAVPEKRGDRVYKKEAMDLLAASRFDPAEVKPGSWQKVLVCFRA